MFRKKAEQVKKLKMLALFTIVATFCLLLAACGDTATSAATAGPTAGITTTAATTTAATTTTASTTTAATTTAATTTTSATTTTAAVGSATAGATTTAAMTAAGSATAAGTTTAAASTAAGTAGSSVNPTFNSSYPAYTGPQVTVTLQSPPSSDTEQNAVQQIVNNFMKQYPNIKVNYQPITSNYPDKLKTELAGSAVPDVITMDSIYAPDFISSGVIEPLDSYISQDKVDTSDFYPNLLSAFQYSGKTYGLPKDYNTLALFYNSKLFQDAGISNPPANWQDFTTDVQKLTKNGVYGLVIDPQLERLLPFVYQNGGNFVSSDGKKMDFDSQATRDALNLFFTNLYKNKYAAKAADVGAGWAGEAYEKGKAAMVIEGGWLIPDLAQKAPDISSATKIAELPAGKSKATLNFTVCYAIPAKSQNKQAAWLLLNYLTSQQGMWDWTNLGVAQPSRKSVSQYFIEKYPARQALIAGASYSHPWAFGPGFQAVVTDGDNDLGAVYAGQQTLDQAISDITSKGNDALSNQ
jgi:multiple sugar transport system substrate-binding protein